MTCNKCSPPNPGYVPREKRDSEKEELHLDQNEGRLPKIGKLNFFGVFASVFRTQK